MNVILSLVILQQQTQIIYPNLKLETQKKSMPICLLTINHQNDKVRILTQEKNLISGEKQAKKKAKLQLYQDIFQINKNNCKETLRAMN